MIIEEFKKLLVSGNVGSFYIFTGDELALMDIYLDKFSSVKNQSIMRIDQLSNVYSKLKNNTILNTSYCYVIRDDKEYQHQDKIWEAIKSGNALGSNNLILVYSNIDKRSKFYKNHQDHIIEFEPLDTPIIRQLIMRKYDISLPAATDICERCENNYGRILLELDKAMTFASINNLDIDQAIETLADEDLLPPKPDQHIFNLVDYICKRDIKKSYQGIAQMEERDENSLGLLTLLYNNFRQILLVESAGSGDICNRTGLTAWQVKLAREKSGYYTIKELVRILRNIRETERGIKTGEIDQKWAMDYLLANIF